MEDDEIIEEVQAVREASAERFGFDVRAIFRDAMESQEKRDRMLVGIEPRIKAVSVEDSLIRFDLVDGRTVGVPLAWSWRLSEASLEQRANFEIIGEGQGVHWPDIDEDISAQGILTGIHAAPR
jgi:hypothetical protein